MTSVRFRLRLVGVAAAITLTPANVPAAEPGIDQDAIAYRKQIMKTLEAQFNAITHIIAFGGPAENLKSHLETVLVASRQVLPSFEKPAPGGTSQPRIWEEWKVYADHMRQFEAAAAMAVEAAKFNSVNQLIWYTDQMSCRKCHDLYKQQTVRGGESYPGY